MFRGQKRIQKPEPVTDDLEPYRQLVELQKQMIKLAKQNDQAKRECAALRERVAHEIAARLQVRRSLRHRLRQKAGKVLKRLPEFTGKESVFILFTGDSMAGARRRL
jgi:hypothetical protein